MPPMPGSPAPGAGQPNAPVPPSTGSPNVSPVGAPPSGPGGGSQPIRVPNGLPYGQGVQLHNAQKAMPVGAPPQGAPPSAGASNPQTIQAATGWTPPTHNLTGPTQRPQEPVTTGIASGPGGGPEALPSNNQPQAPDPLVTGLAVLNTIPNPDSASADLKAVIQAMIGNRTAG